MFEPEAFFRPLAESGLGVVSGVRQVRAILHKAARLAEKWSGDLMPNPVSLADLPKSSSKQSQARSPTLEGVGTILTAVEVGTNMQIALPIRLIASTSTRRRGAAALRCSDISFESPEVIVDE